MPSLCAIGRGGDRDGLAVEADLAAVGAQDAIDDVHQRRLAGAVLAGEGVDLALAQLELDAAQRVDRSERLAQIRDLEDQDRVCVTMNVDCR